MTILVCRRCGATSDPLPDTLIQDGLLLKDWFKSRYHLCSSCYLAVEAPGALVGDDDSDVQIAGALFAMPGSGTRRREAYDAICATGRRGATFDELTRNLNRSYNNVGPRVRELVQGRWVADSGRTRTSGSSGAQQVVWVAL